LLTKASVGPDRAERTLLSVAFDVAVDVAFARVERTLLSVAFDLAVDVALEVAPATNPESQSNRLPSLTLILIIPSPFFQLLTVAPPPALTGVEGSRRLSGGRPRPPLLLAYALFNLDSPPQSQCSAQTMFSTNKTAQAKGPRRSFLTLYIQNIKSEGVIVSLLPTLLW
jgi:hypothetical protein